MQILLLNQCFYPDHVATAQHLTELAQGLRSCGHEVTVVASSRGYENPQTCYPSKEVWNEITIHRIWTPGLGKGAKWRRFINFAGFWISATLILLKLPRFDVTVCLTSPPLISTLGTLMTILKGGSVVPWVMDLNPDEAVAAGWLKAGGAFERTLSLFQNLGLRRASRIVALDRFMAARLAAKGIPEKAIHVDPPWSHDKAVRFDLIGRDTFRQEHGLENKFVIMYSGNHSPCHPLDTLLQATLSVRDQTRFHFLFVGGGSEFEKVKAFQKMHKSGNITTLPYQPIELLSASLSSADLHVVVLGEAFVGIVHPCKIYNILTLGIPFLTIGPEESHLSDLASRLPKLDLCYHVNHGDILGVKKTLIHAVTKGVQRPSVELQSLGREFGVDILCPRLIRVIEDAAVRT